VGENLSIPKASNVSQYWQAVTEPYKNLPKWVQVTGGIGNTLLIANPLTLLPGALLACLADDSSNNPPCANQSRRLQYD